MPSSSVRLSHCAVVFVALVSAGSETVGAQELRNWFDDPFFQITTAIPKCPEPAGPRVTEAERLVQSHHRAEKGTTCWLAKECDRPTAYSYDRDIAQEIQAAAKQHSMLLNSSLWVTVQARIVYVEGCVRHESQANEIEAFVRALPYVQQAIAIVTDDPGARVPYRRFTSR